MCDERGKKMPFSRIFFYKNFGGFKKVRIFAAENNKN